MRVRIKKLPSEVRDRPKEQRQPERGLLEEEGREQEHDGWSSMELRKRPLCCGDPDWHG